MKAFVTPLGWFFVLQLTLLMLLYSQSWSVLGFMSRVSWGLLLFSVIGLIILSLPVTESILARSLVFSMNQIQSKQSPDYIIVLGGGYDPGRRVQEDVLNDASYRRVSTAALLWHQHPSATLILSGISLEHSAPSPARMGQLMAQVAMLHGVLQEKIMLEPHSINTREHAIEALKLPGITPQTPITLVTSAWHLRRAKQEFDRYFTHIQLYPVPFASSALGWQSFLPDAHALSGSTIYLREWVGMAWYAVVAKMRK